MSDKEIKFVLSADSTQGRVAINRFNESLKEMGHQADETSKRSDSMAGTFFNAQIAADVFAKSVQFLRDAFVDGLKEISETEAATRRLEATSKSTGIALGTLTNIANQISADHLIEADQAMQGIADLANKGFKSDDISKMAAALKDIAASAGGNTQQNFQQLVDAITSGRMASADLVRMLPNLKSTLESAGVSMSDMADESKKAQVQQALLKAIMEQGNIVAGASAEKLKTVAGQMEAMTNVSKDLKEAWATGLTSGFQDASSAMGGAAQTMSELQGTIQALGSGISITLVAAFKSLKFVIDELTKPFETLIETFIALPGYLTELDTKFQNAGRALIESLKLGVSEKWNEFTGFFKDKLQWIRDHLPGSDAKTGPLSTLMKSGRALWTTFGEGMHSSEQSVLDAVSNVVTGIADKLGSIGSTFKGLKNGWSQVTSSFGKKFDFGNLMSGLSGVAGAISTGIQLATQLFSALKNLFGHNWGKDVANQLSIFLPGIEVSKELQKQIAQLAKDVGDAATAVALSLGKIIDEVGITRDNFKTFAQEALNVFSLLQSGAISAAQATDVLNDVFPKLAQAALDFGKVGDAQIVQMIRDAHQFGLEIKSITDYVNGQLQKAISGWTAVTADFADRMSAASEKIKALTDRMNAAIASGNQDLADRIERRITRMTTHSQNEFDRLARIAMKDFNAMIANGASYTEAMSALAPVIDHLRDAQEAMGLKASGAFKKLEHFQTLVEGHKKLVDSVSGLNQELEALANIGELDAKTFRDMEKQGNQTFNRLIKAGFSQGEALKMMAPYYQNLLNLSQQYGIKLDANTQKHIDQAKAAGLVKDASLSMENIMMTGLGEIIKLLGGELPEAWQKAANGANAFAKDGKKSTDDVHEHAKKKGKAAGEDFILEGAKGIRRKKRDLMSAWKDAVSGLSGSASLSFRFSGEIERFAHGAPAMITKPGIYYGDPGDIIISPDNYSGNPAAVTTPIGSGFAGPLSGSGESTLYAEIPITVINQIDSREIGKTVTQLSRQGRVRIEKRQATQSLR